MQHTEKPPDYVCENLPHLVYPYTMYGDMHRFLHQPKPLRDKCLHNKDLVYSRAGTSARQCNRLINVLKAPTTLPLHYNSCATPLPV